MPTTFAHGIIKLEVDILDYKFLGNINSPADLKNLSDSEINELCTEVRDCLIETVSKNGGHLASNLGVVELTVALHRFLNLPEDSLIFDVGHQCYTHKLLTGRFNAFSTIRQENGISGFMRPDESEYDPFVTGHASNSLAAAYGIYKANQLSGKQSTCVAVIGDGAMTGGLALEALNNIGGNKGRFIVILNDNKMSISTNVGSMSRHLKRIRLKPGYYRFKSSTENILQKIPLVGNPIYKLLSKIKRAFVRQVFKNNMFETLGFKYIGPVDGHNVSEIENALKVAAEHTHPCVIHAVTVKGKGYSFAEAQPGNYHGVSAFDTNDGLVLNADKNFSAVCGETLCELAKNDKRICAITAAMTSGTGLDNFAKKYKNRFFDVGIAEEYAATFAAGLATAGMRPYFAVYSSFLQRSYDQIIHDTAIAKLPVCYLVDRAGIVGDDGETHQGVFDAAFLSTVPGITVYSPASYSELEGLLKKSVDFSSPIAIRYPRGKEIVPFEFTDTDYTVFGKGSKKTIVTYGIISAQAISAQEKLAEKGICVDVIKLNKIYPLSEELAAIINEYDEIFIFEEGIKKGGIAEHIAANVNPAKYSITAIDNAFVPAAKAEKARKLLGLDAESMMRKIMGE